MDKSAATIARWLKEAHALEGELSKIFDEHVRVIDDVDPELMDSMRSQAARARSHAERIDECLARLDQGASAASGIGAAVRGTLQALRENTAKDRELHLYAEEYARTAELIGWYLAVVGAARLAGENDTAMAVEEILAEERASITWLEEAIPKSAKEFAEQDI